MPIPRLFGPAVALFTGVVLPLRAQASRSDSVPDSVLVAAISRFASDSDGSLSDLEILHRAPARAAALLVARLQPVPRGSYTSGHHPHVVWYLRALRSLTGLDFRAHTDSVLREEEYMGGGEKWFLGADSGNTVRFFGTWMSRDRTWVPPHDAQIRIIEQWRQWFTEHGTTFPYVNQRDVNHWYF